MTIFFARLTTKGKIASVGCGTNQTGFPSATLNSYPRFFQGANLTDLLVILILSPKCTTSIMHHFLAHTTLVIEGFCVLGETTVLPGGTFDAPYTDVSFIVKAAFVVRSPIA